MDLSAHNQRALLDIARNVIRRKLAQVQSPAPDEPTDDPLKQPAGCFVSLHELNTHCLRGCVGHIQADMPLINSVRDAADAVLHDPRFTRDPVKLEELPSLEIELTVLSPLRAATDPLTFDLENDGLWLTVGDRSGCFLPQVARDTGWDRQTLLERLCAEKLNLPTDAWKWPKAELRLFSTLIVGPEPFIA